MLHQGQIMLDISGAERASMTIPDLLKLFQRKEGTELADDQLLLA
jgi:putative ABC transport system ATP-binding protein